MNPQISKQPESIGRYRWTICALLFFATTINYLDRQVLSLLAPQLSEEFNWSNSDYANITAVFQFAYAICILFAGRFIDLMGTQRGFLIAVGIWSFGAILHAYAIPLGELTNSFLGLVGIVAVPVSLAGFILARSMLALGEAGNFPAAIKATAEYFPKKERALATGIFNSGANVGAILAPLTVPWIAVNWGWQTAFIVIGGMGFIWMLFWILFYAKPEQQKRLSAAELNYISSDDAPELLNHETVHTQAQSLGKKISWITLLTYRQTWAFVIGKFLTDGVWWFFLFWLPKYLGEQYGLKGVDLILPLSVLYTMTMFGSVAGGAFPLYFFRRGYSVYDGRMKAMCVIALFPLLVLLAQPLGHISFWIPIILIGIGASAHQAWSANMFTSVSDNFPKRIVASVVGIGGLAGGMGGVLISKIGGWLFDFYALAGQVSTGYSIMFMICALAYLLAWSLMKLLVPRYKPIVDF